MNWIIIASISSLLFGVYNFFLKISADKINPILATFILTSSAALISLLTMIFLRVFSIDSHFNWTSNGIKFAILAGIFSGLGELLYFVLFSKGFPLTIGLPFTFALTVLVGIILGVLVTHESLDLLKLIGIIFTLVGIAILSRY